MRTDALLGPVAGVVAAILALACEAGLPRPRFVQQTTAALRLVGYPPPPARVEMIPRRPAGDPVWIDGEWSWSGSAWGWVAGRWVVAPPGTFFAAWTTVRDAEGNVYFASGAWHDASGAEIAAPPALATATATKGSVTSASGDSEKTTRVPSPAPGPTAAPPHP